MDPNIKQSIIDRLKQTNNVLVTVKNNPTVDQLAACIGLTLFLNKLGKHATAVFSGAVPSTIEFLKPEDTLEKDTNSLRDFIIALDKSKADKLRYKVEDKVVKIFITPYRTSLSQDDLEFSQGDFNVDVVIALGVHAREELDQAIVAHGRILHDATVVSVNNSKLADLGALNWNDDKASSLCEMTATLVDGLQANSLDAQIATALLTGIVAETDRFSKPNTTSVTMSLSAKLMAAGANQQLVATKLQEPAKAIPVESSTNKPDAKEVGDGTLEIEHQKGGQDTALELPELEGDDADAGEIHIDEEGNLKPGLQDQESTEKKATPAGRITFSPPTMGGTLTANTTPNQAEPSIDPLSGQSTGSSLLSHDADQKSSETKTSSESGATDDASQNKRGITIQPSQTLSDIEEDVNSPHLAALTPAAKPEATSGDGQAQSAANLPLVTGIDDARKAVQAAAQNSMESSASSPIQALNAQPLGEQLHTAGPQPAAPQVLPPVMGDTTGLNLPPNLVPPTTELPQEQTASNQPPTAPPPVPPPMMPPQL